LPRYPGTRQSWRRCSHRPRSDWAGRAERRWGEQPIAVVSDHGRWFALLGIPLDTLPGDLEIGVFSVDRDNPARGGAD
jgi:hypothetical protein